MGKVFITNGRVAWQVPPGRIAKCLLEGLYEAPDGWRVVGKPFIEKWPAGELGELRKEGSKSPVGIS